jgi:hypothetical protein
MEIVSCNTSNIGRDGKRGTVGLPTCRSRKPAAAELAFAADAAGPLGWIRFMSCDVIFAFVFALALAGKINHEVCLQMVSSFRLQR